MCVVALMGPAGCGGTAETGPTSLDVPGKGGSSTGGSAKIDGEAGLQDGGALGTAAGGLSEGGSNPAGQAGSPDNQAMTDLDGKWTGYIENYVSSDQSDAVALELAMKGNAVTGTATFGNSRAPAPATDPAIGYLPDANIDSSSGPYPGFAFTIQNGSLNESRLKFDISSQELWKAWCKQQTPIADEANQGTYACVHNWITNFTAPCSQTDPMTQTVIAVDCGKLALCHSGGTCNCTANACSVAATPMVHFDLNMVPPNATGSISGLDMGLHSTLLTKD